MLSRAEPDKPSSKRRLLLTYPSILSLRSRYCGRHVAKHESRPLAKEREAQASVCAMPDRVCSECLGSCASATVRWHTPQQTLKPHLAAATPCNHHCWSGKLSSSRGWSNDPKPILLPERDVQCHRPADALARPSCSYAGVSHPVRSRPEMVPLKSQCLRVRAITILRPLREAWCPRYEGLTVRSRVAEAEGCSGNT